jgi:hypothetical protein
MNVHVRDSGGGAAVLVVFEALEYDDRLDAIPNPQNSFHFYQTLYFYEYTETALCCLF